LLRFRPRRRDHNRDGGLAGGDGGLAGGDGGLAGGDGGLAGGDGGWDGGDGGWDGGRAGREVEGEVRGGWGGEGGCGDDGFARKGSDGIQVCLRAPTLIAGRPGCLDVVHNARSPRGGRPSPANNAYSSRSKAGVVSVVPTPPCSSTRLSSAWGRFGHGCCRCCRCCCVVVVVVAVSG
ncbi:uncharacterized protein EV422DRAFT_604587, partial [Fimicolochytrium jonesii]|uniref:uncharacterized protein n=1 Tax=Fimicolochytrium jonesii TaxID=1396493 RepID=UPI0022FEE323